MYLRILKRDLNRKKTMNVILLLFITLASMFVASSVNNILSVTTALDDYFEMANAPDYLGATMNKSESTEIGEVLDGLETVESYRTERILYMANSMISSDRKEAVMPSGTVLLQGDGVLALNYFLEDNSILTDVAPGEVYMTLGSMEKAKLAVGDTVTITIEEVSKEFRIVGAIKDAVLGSNGLSITRFIVDETEFDSYDEAGEINSLYGGALCYLEADDVDGMLAELEEEADFVISLDRDYMRFCYVFDMIVTGILLAVSILFIVISFVVLRFTITFTLSEEYREIGVMKAIGMKNGKIRGLYLTKYAVLAVVGSVIGLVLSFPFGKLLKEVSSKSVILGGGNVYIVNVLCSLAVIAVILLFCYGCTRRVTGFTPVDAIRNGQTGERFRKKSIMNFGKSQMGTTAFLATNDIVSGPKRYSIVTLTFALCLSITLVLSASASTLKSDRLLPTFGMVDCHAMVNISGGDAMSFMTEGGREVLKEYLAEMEAVLAEHGMSATCVQELAMTLTVKNGDYQRQIPCFQATGTTTEQYEYMEGTAPECPGEIAMTKMAADNIHAAIGDTVTIISMEGEREYVITALFQSMNSRGESVRFHEDEEINYIQMSGGTSGQIIFHDNPSADEVEERVEEINTFFEKYGGVTTASEWVGTAVGVADTIDSIKGLMMVLTVILTALVTVLMERSFIAKETREIALMKAVGFKNGKIYAYHTARFAIIGVVAVLLAELLMRPLLRICIDPIFKMMGMELAVDYAIKPMEVYAVLPVVLFITTVAAAFLTALYTRKIKASDVAGME